MIKIFDMVNGVFETPGNPDVPVSPTVGKSEQQQHNYQPEDLRPRLQEVPRDEEIQPQPELPPVMIDISIDSFIRRQ